MRSRITCTYCGRRRLCRPDHVPPKSLYPPPRPSNLITVDSCHACNRGFSLDDEYFTLIISAGIDDTRFPDVLAYSVKRIKNLGRPESEAFLRAILGKQEGVWHPGQSGLFMRSLVQHVDGPRVLRIIARIARGLYRHVTARRLRTQASIWCAPADKLSPPEAAFIKSHAPLFRGLESQPLFERGRGHFRYQFFVAAPQYSVWWLSFYGLRPFWAVTYEEKTGGA